MKYGYFVSGGILTETFIPLVLSYFYLKDIFH